MARSRKSKKSTDKAEDSAEISDKVEGASGETVEAVAEADSGEAADAVEETVSGTEDTPDAAEEADSVSGESSQDETAAQEPEDGTSVPDAVDDATASEKAEGEVAEETDLGDDTLLTEGESDPSAEADAPSLEETPDEAQDDTLLEDTPEAAGGADKEGAPEPETERKTEPVAAAATAPVQQQSSSFWPAIFGGLIAALLGFIAGRGDTVDQFLPASMQRAEVDLTALEGETAALAQTDLEQADALEALTEGNVALLARLEALETAEPVVVEGAADTSGLTNSIAGLEESLAAIADRIAALEERPVAVEPEGDFASTDEIAVLQESLAAQQAEIEALSERAAAAEAEAAGEARRILARAALTRVVTAVDTGEPYAPALQDLEESVAADVPDPIRATATSGVPTMAALREGFPEAARAGLAAARAEVPESDVQGIGDFLKRTLKARSVVPKEGDDPDAVLSRAEAALRAGDLDTALMETEALPEPAKAAMSDWLDAATARKSVQDAANELADSLNSN